MKRKNTHIQPTRKTKDDFVRWLKEKQALKKQTAEKQITNTSRDSAHAFMVWADDGGALVISQPLIRTIKPRLVKKEKKHEQGKR